MLACFPAARACVSLPEDFSGLWNLFCPLSQKARNARGQTFSGERPQTTTNGNGRTNTPAPSALEWDNWSMCSILALRFPQWDLAPANHNGYLLENETFTELFLHSPTSISQNCLSSKLTVLKSVWPTLCPTGKWRNQNWTEVIKHCIFRAQIVLMWEGNTEPQ